MDKVYWNRKRLYTYRFFLNFYQEEPTKHIDYFPNHLLSFYKSKSIVDLKNTESIYPRLVTLPLHPDLSEEDIRYIVNCLTNLI